MAAVEEFRVKVTTEGVQQLDQVGSKVDQLSSKFGALAGTIGSLGLLALAKAAIQTADAIQDLSDATGIAVGSILGFQKAMEAAGGKASNAERAITSFYGAIERAADGSLKTQKAFEKVGVSLDDLRNLSEAELLQKTIDGLSRMQAGSERTAIATELLSKAFRGVDPKALQDALSKGNFDDLERSIKAGADAAQALEKAFGNIKIAALQALEPLLKLLGDQEVGVKNATLAIQVLAGVMVVAFGASMLANIIAINRALAITTGLANLMGKTPLGIVARLAAMGGVAAATAVAIDQLTKENEALAESEKKVGQAIKSTEPSGGPAGRTVTAAVDPAAKALAESRKRIAEAEAETRKLTAFQTATDIEKIELEAQAATEKARSEIFSKENLTRAQMEKEFAAKVGEINAKMALDIATNRKAIERKNVEEMLAMQEEFNTAMGQLAQQQDQAALSAFNQVDALRIQNEEMAKRMQFAQSSIGMSTAERDLAQKLLDIEIQREQARRALNNIPNLTNDARIREEERLNKLYEDRIKLVQGEAAARAANEQNFQQGFENTIKRMEEMYTPLKRGEATANAVFGAMDTALNMFVEKGKFSFGDFARSLIADLIRIELKASATSFMRSLLGNIFGGGFGTGSSFGNMDYGAFFATGGAVRSNRMSIVGERGPELFIPSTSGRIVPSNELRQPSSQPIVNNYYTVSAIDSRSVAQFFAENRMTMLGTVEQARRELPMRTR